MPQYLPNDCYTILSWGFHSCQLAMTWRDQSYAFHLLGCARFSWELGSIYPDWWKGMLWFPWAISRLIAIMFPKSNRILCYLWWPICFIYFRTLFPPPLMCTIIPRQEKKSTNKFSTCKKLSTCYGKVIYSQVIYNPDLTFHFKLSIESSCAYLQSRKHPDCVNII